MSLALVLGGGGPVGMAWEFGVLSGIASARVSLLAQTGRRDVSRHGPTIELSSGQARSGCG
jgi:hypothetical protein